ncbi:MAG TPA: hypothetical protein VIT91_05900 [Chthoniobacterales bacterium]
MRTALFFLIGLVALTGCSTPPPPVQSAFFRTGVATYSRNPDGTANAVFHLSVSSSAPLPLYVEATLPSPDPATTVTSRKSIPPGQPSVSFMGPDASGWQSGKIYTFSLKAFTDPGYRHQVDALTQQSLYKRPLFRPGS